MSVPPPAPMSSRLSSMKFMQRRDETKNRDKLEKERETVLNDAQWVHGTGVASNVVRVEDSRPLKFTPGRRSFGQFNPQVEKLVETVRATIYGVEADEDAIGDEDMVRLVCRCVRTQEHHKPCTLAQADQMSEYRGLPGKNRPAKKRKKGDDGDKKGGANSKRVKVEGGDGVVTSDVRSRAAQFLDGIAGGETNRDKVKAESKTFVKPRRDLPV